jgi:hypothetical protein
METPIRNPKLTFGFPSQLSQNVGSLPFFNHASISARF